MSEQREVVILSGVRTAIGDYGGSLKDIAPSDLAARVVKEAVSPGEDRPEGRRPVRVRQRHPHRAQGHVHFAARLRERRPAARHRRADAEPPVRQRAAGDRLGVAVRPARRHRCRGRGRRREHEPRRATRRPTQRWGARMGETKSFDMMVGALTDPFDTVHMGITAENVAAKCGLVARAAGCIRRARATSAHRRRQSRPGTSRARSCRSSSRARRGPSCSTPTSTSASDASLEGHGQAPRRIHQGERHRHRRQRVGHQRCGRRRRADGEVGGRQEGIEADGAARRLRSRRHRSQDHGARPGHAP